MTKKTIADALTKPIELESEAEYEQVQELHGHYKAKTRLLFEHYGIAYIPEADHAQQLFHLVIAMGKDHFDGLKIKGKKGRKTNSEGPEGLKLFAVFEAIRRQTRWNTKDIARALVQKTDAQVATCPFIENTGLDVEPGGGEAVEDAAIESLNKRYLKAETHAKARYEDAKTAYPELISESGHYHCNEISFEEYVAGLILELEEVLGAGPTFHHMAFYEESTPEGRQIHYEMESTAPCPPSATSPLATSDIDALYWETVLFTSLETKAERQARTDCP